ncbi:MAG: DUF4388 domain-containing protein [Acidobacteria bacterium]|nr:DUF4388 domain-containing protein [Acidobacteriota bacterium]
MAIEGSLDSVDIQDIVQLLNINRSNGILHIENHSLKGKLYYTDGEIINAEVEGMGGEAAAYVLLAQHEGSFFFQMSPHSSPRAFTRSIHDLVLEAARRKDTIGKIRTSIQHDNIVYLPLVDIRIPHLAKDFSPEELQVLKFLDGQADIKEVVANSGRGAFEVLYVIYDLEQRGHLKRVDIYKLLEVDVHKKLFGKATDIVLSEMLVNDWSTESMVYADCDTLEIRTQKGNYGEVNFVSKPNVAADRILIPREIMDQLEIAMGEKVLVKPLLHPT